MNIKRKRVSCKARGEKKRSKRRKNRFREACNVCTGVSDENEIRQMHQWRPVSSPEIAILSTSQHDRIVSMLPS